ncbi:hypothetical protein DFJ74DRAFT_464591 [Hyaloraphidium curvatum]|nr:hypothetical protein DFJ74DRAFT_464591 [Hyaloraphidium curvatum]
MSLQSLLLSRANPIRVGLIGSGKFGSMFLNQVPTSRGLEVTAIADLDPSRARAAVREVGWSSERTARTSFLKSGAELAAREDVDVVVEATGSPAAGIAHAREAFRNRKHVVMVNVEADCLVGPLLAAEARDAGVVYSLAYGDQPALIAEIVDWARSAGFEVVAAGKGTKYLPEYHEVTPDGVWKHYGLSSEEAKKAGMNSQMFNSFLDGTKSAIEMAAVANACGLPPHRDDGLLFPPCPAESLASVLVPKEAGGMLERTGTVEVVSSLYRDGREVPNDLRWGVFAVFRAPNSYAAACFKQYGLRTSPCGWYAAMYKPFHLIGLELGISVLNAALRGEPTGQARSWLGDVASVAKKDLNAGEMLDGEGGWTVYGRLVPSALASHEGTLPIGLAHGVRLKKSVRRGEIVRKSDVEAPQANAAWIARQEMEAKFGAGRRDKN